MIIVTHVGIRGIQLYHALEVRNGGRVLPHLVIGDAPGYHRGKEKRAGKKRAKRQYVSKGSWYPLTCNQKRCRRYL